MAILRILTIILIAMSVGLEVAQLANLRLFFKKSRAIAPLKRYPPVSIIKPLRGTDSKLAGNLRSFLDIDYPDFELIFAVADPDDPAVPLVRDLMSRSGNRKVKLVIDPSAIGYNPKVSNLHNGVKAATGDILLFSDSDVRATPDLIRRLIGPLEDEAVGIVSGPAVILGTRGFWQQAKSVTYNSTVTLYNALWCRFIPITVGGAAAMRRDVFDRIGGFAPIADLLTDDQELGKLVHRHGYRVELVPYLVTVCEEPMRFLPVIRQNLRWLVAIKSSTPIDYQFILLANMTFLGFLYWLLKPAHPAHIAVFAALGAVRTGASFHLHWKYLKDRGLARYSWAILFIDFVLPVLWLIGQWRRRVTWRGTDYDLRKGKLVPVKK